MNTKTIIILFQAFLFLAVSCKSKEQKNCSYGKEMIIRNKAEYCFLGSKTEKIDSDIICKELKNNSQIAEGVSTQLNSGFIEIIDNNKVLFFIIYSDLNGPVIRSNGIFYRNDKLVLNVMKQLKMKMRVDATKECYMLPDNIVKQL